MLLMLMLVLQAVVARDHAVGRAHHRHGLVRLARDLADEIGGELLALGRQREPDDLEDLAAGEEGGAHEQAERPPDVAEEVDRAVPDRLSDELELQVLECKTKTGGYVSPCQELSVILSW